MWPYCLCQGNIHDIIIGKPLGTGNYNLKMSKLSTWSTYFRILTTIPLQRCVLGITISNMEGNQPTRAEKWWFPSSCQTLVAILSWCHYQETPLAQVSLTFIPTDIKSAISISLWFWLNIAMAKESSSLGPIVNVCKFQQLLAWMRKKEVFHTSNKINKYGLQR